jgi:hypothetical protein
MKWNRIDSLLKPLVAYLRFNAGLIEACNAQVGFLVDKKSTFHRGFNRAILLDDIEVMIELIVGWLLGWTYNYDQKVAILPSLALIFVADYESQTLISVQ